MGVHIAIDAIEVEVATVGGEELWRETATVDLRGLSVEDGYGIIAAVVTEQVQRLDVGRELIAVEVGMGGYVSRERGLVTSAHVFGWEDVSLRERLERTLWEAGVTNPVNVGVANDCQLAALYSGRNEVHLPNDLVAVYLGGLRNLGSGVIIDGEIFGGAHGGAGDLGHVNVAIEGGVCWCGRSSCLQMIVSPQALLTRSGLLPADEAAELVDRRPLEAMALLVDAAEAGNEKVLQTLATAGDTLGTVLDDFLGSINPHAAIIGGYLGMLAPYLMPSLESRLAGRIARPAFATTRVIAVDHFDRRVVRGAVLAARDGVLTEPLTLTRMSA